MQLFHGLPTHQLYQLLNHGTGINILPANGPICLRISQIECKEIACSLFLSLISLCRVRRKIPEATYGILQIAFLLFGYGCAGCHQIFASSNQYHKLICSVDDGPVDAINGSTSGPTTLMGTEAVL